MYTETELRDALQHSAARADTIDADLTVAGSRDPDALASGSGSDEAAVHDLVDVARDRQRRRAWLPVAAAAVIVAAAAVAITVVTGGGDGTGTPAGHDESSVVPPIVAGVVDAVQAAPTGNAPVSYSFKPGGTRDTRDERLAWSVQAGDLHIDVVHPSRYFDPARIDRSRPVSVAGTTGYYGHLSSFPLNGDGDDDAAAWAVAFPRPDGAWVVVRISGRDAGTGSVDDPAAIVAAFDQLHLSFANDVSRLPVRFGFLPSGARLGQLEQASVVDGSAATTVTLLVGRDLYTVQVSSRSGGATSCSPSPCGGGTLDRTEHGLTVHVSGADQTTARRILDSATLPTSATDRSTWWTIDQAFGA